MNYQLDLTQTFLAATLLLTVVAVLDLSARKLSAAFRHGLWAAAMFALLVLPFVQPYLPPLMQFGTSDASVLDVVWDRTILQAESPVQPRVSGTMGTFAQHAASPSSSSHSTVLLGQPPAVRNVVAQFGPLFFHASDGVPWQVLLPAFFIICLLIVIGLLRIVGIFLSHRSASRWIRESTPIDDSNIVSLCHDIAKRFRISKKVRLLKHPMAEVPLVVSIWRPAIILPVSFGERPPEEWETVLTHELAHVKRNDLFWQLVAQWSAVLYWIHPLFWYARWRMRLEREAACDDMVLRSGGEAERYASTLLELAKGKNMKQFERRLPSCAVPIARSNAVARRIKDILNPSLNRRPLWRAVMFGFLVLFTAMIFASIMAVQRPNESRRLYTIAVPRSDSEIKVQIRGTVVMPDGTAPQECYVNVSSMAHHCDDRSYFFLSPRRATGYHASNSGRRLDNGEPFEFNVPIGSNILLKAGTPFEFAAGTSVRGTSRTKEQEVFVAQPYTFYVMEKKEDIVLQLEKATPVTGTLRYANGDPVIGRDISAVQFIPAARGADIPSVRNNSMTGVSALTNEHGEFEFQLWSGEFTLSVGTIPWSEPVTKTIFVEQGKPLEVDMEIPTALRINVVMPDGSPAEDYQLCQLMAYQPFRGSGSMPAVDIKQIHPPFSFAHEDPIMTYLCPGENYVIATTNDNEFGIVRKLEPELIGKELTLTLRPTVSGTVTLTDQSGSILANHEAAIRIRIMKTGGGDNYVQSTEDIGAIYLFRTDAEGRLDFKVPVFEGISDSVWLCFQRKSGGGGGGQWGQWSWWGSSSLDRRFSNFRPPADGAVFDLGTMVIEQ